MPKKRNKLEHAWTVMKGLGIAVKGGLSVLLTLLFIFILLGSVGELNTSGNIAVIPIHGVISSASIPFSDVVSSDKIIGWLNKANQSENIKAIVLDINSPGGSPVASAEIAEAIQKIDKPVIAVIRETGASGAYWIATATDKIYANRMSLTGSIGVTASSLAFPGLIANYNVTYRRLVAGKYKDAGTPFREMTTDEEQLFDNLLQDLYDEFVSAVARNRHMSVARVEELATGFVYLGAEAKTLGLIDALGSKQDAIDYAASLIGEPADVIEFKNKPSLMDALTQSMSTAFYSMGKGMTSSLSTDMAVQLR